MRNGERYPFVPLDAILGEASFRPCLPLTLVYQQSSVMTSGLLDTGASVNVLPYSVGIELGYVWERQTTALSLMGNLAQYEARVVLVQAVVGQFNPVQLAFAWTQAATQRDLLRRPQAPFSNHQASGIIHRLRHSPLQAGLCTLGAPSLASRALAPKVRVLRWMSRVFGSTFGALGRIGRASSCKVRVASCQPRVPGLTAGVPRSSALAGVVLIGAGCSGG